MPKIVTIGSREYLSQDFDLVPVDRLDRISFNPAAIIDGEPRPRLEMRLQDGSGRNVLTGEDAVQMWQFLSGENL
jgi:hypothetical protein